MPSYYQDQQGLSFNSAGLAASSLVATGQGVLHSIAVGAVTVLATFQIFDNTSASGTILFDTSALPVAANLNIILDTRFNIGLFFNLSVGAMHIAISWR